jgi:hypothetical protein
LTSVTRLHSGPQRKEVTGEWRKLRKKEPLELCLTSVIIVTLFEGQQKGEQNYFGKNLTKRGCSNNLCVDGTIILKWNLNGQDTMPWTGCTLIRIEISDGLVSKR